MQAVRDTIRRFRRLWVMRIVGELALFLALVFVWLVFLHPHVALWWLLVVILPVHLLLSARVDARLVCPQCRQKLHDIDGTSIFSRSCEHCGASFT